MSAKKKLINLAKQLEFKSETEYFDYIILSSINGQSQQVRNLYNDMRITDRKDFLDYLAETEYYERIRKTLDI
jgi:hypothetical protein